MDTLQLSEKKFNFNDKSKSNECLKLLINFADIKAHDKQCIEIKALNLCFVKILEGNFSIWITPQIRLIKILIICVCSKGKKIFWFDEKICGFSKALARG